MKPLIKKFKTDYFEYEYIENVKLNIKGWKLRALPNITTFKTEAKVKGIPVVSLDSTFNNISIPRIDVSQMDTRYVVTANEAFRMAHITNGIDIHTWNLENLVNAREMFHLAETPRIDMHNMQLPNLKHAHKMFYYTLELEELNLTGLQTGIIDTYTFMFACCSKLEVLDIRGIEYNTLYGSYDILELSNIPILLVSSYKLAVSLEHDYDYKIMLRKHISVEELEKIKAKSKLLGLKRMCLMDLSMQQGVEPGKLRLN